MKMGGRLLSAVAMTTSVKNKERRNLKDYLATLFLLDDKPERISLSFALGVLIGFSPFLGFHTIICNALALAFGMNLLAILAGSLLNNPFTMVLIYGGEFWVGMKLIKLAGGKLPPLDLGSLRSLSGFSENVIPYIAPLFIGYFLLGGIAFGCSYFILRTMLSRRKKRITKIR
jgi:uncharacterized protein (DUF2062 family)